SQHRYNAACAAALAAAGEGSDGSTLGELDRLSWRVQASVWLRADLAAWAAALARGAPGARQGAARALAHRQQDPRPASARRAAARAGGGRWAGVAPLWRRAGAGQ